MLLPSAAAKGLYRYSWAWKLLYEFPHTNAIPDTEVFRSRKPKKRRISTLPCRSAHCPNCPRSATAETTIENALHALSNNNGQLALSHSPSFIAYARLMHDLHMRISASFVIFTGHHLVRKAGNEYAQRVVGYTHATPALPDVEEFGRVLIYLLKVTKQTSLFELLNRLHPELNPNERTILSYICAQLEQNGRTSVDLTIRNLADATGLCWRTVQKYRRSLLAKSVLRLLSVGRERSRYALAAGIAVHREDTEVRQQESEETISPSQQPAASMSADEEIAALMTSITGADGSANILSEAEQLAGGKVKLRDLLRQIQANPRQSLSSRSVLSLISRLSYATGSRPAQKY
jgi:hypothetical protein